MNYGINSLTIEVQMAGGIEEKFSTKGTLISRFHVLAPAGFKGDKLGAVVAVAFGKTAEEIRNIRDGETFVIQGKLSVEVWEDRTSGKNRTKLQIQVDRILRQLEEREEAPQAQPQPARASKPTPAPTATQPPLEGDDVPF